MRALMISDLRAVLRVLRAAPIEGRAPLCALLFKQADLADRYTRRLGKPHPRWGGGTLQGSAIAYPMADEMAWSESELGSVCHALAEALAARVEEVR